MTKFADLKTKKDRTAFIREKLGTDRGWAIKGLIRIYANQTVDEQATKSTNNLNGIGFTGIDAEILSSFAEQYHRRGSLSAKQMALLFKKMPKYAKQLESISAPYMTPEEKAEHNRRCHEAVLTIVNL